MTDPDATDPDVTAHQAVEPSPHLAFTERMSGFVSDRVVEAYEASRGRGKRGWDEGLEDGEVREGYAVGQAEGRAGGSPIEFLVTTSYEDLDASLSDPVGHPGLITGTVIGTCMSTQPLTITDGTFVLIEPNDRDVETWNMRYDMNLVSGAGHRFRFRGFKVLHDRPGFDAWSDTTTLYTTIETVGEDELRRAVGIMTLTVSDFLRQLRGMEVTGVRNPYRRWKYLLEFGRMFARSLTHIYGGPLDEANRFPQAPEDPTAGHCAQLPGRPPLDTAIRQVFWCHGGEWHDEARDARGKRAAELQLTRYVKKEKDLPKAKRKGPVMLAPGFGMAARSFATETIDRNLVEALVEADFDVWLFDYRASICLPSSRDQFTLDDIVTEDWPTAIDKVLKETKARSVQALGHCVGSVTLLMAMLSGNAKKVRSAVCSQFTVHWLTSGFNNLKADLNITTVLSTLKIDKISPDNRFNAPNIALDLGLRAVPMSSEERCGKAVCRWINFVYGCTHRHAQLNEATHDALSEMFGVGNLTSFAQLSRMTRAQKAVDAKGNDVYVTDRNRRGIGTIPILFLQGDRNYIFHPEGSKQTYNWLRDANDPELYTYRLLPGYAHLDSMVGKDAATQVYPYILEYLELTAFSDGGALEP
ncbi:MAG: hypothetical protein M3Q23_05995 [Actinomycetota bacterium]|nr:hypothetical protein [Actinomycetota bacterium]